MTRVRYVVAAFLIAAGSFTGGALWIQQRGTPAAATIYTCPMHPEYRSPQPGDCPVCGMRLEPMKAGGPGAAGAQPAIPGAVRVSPERQQAIGVRLGTAEHAGGTRTLRTTGRVAPRENATYPIIAGVSGWIRSVGRPTTGTLVKKDDLLASFYAPEFVVAQQSYYASLETVDRVSSQQLQTYNQNRVVEGLQRFADQLRNMGVSEAQLTRMTQRRELVQDIHVTSPVDGFVLQRNVSPGLRFDRGFEFYRIADLTRVWIMADVYQHQLPFLRHGAEARITAAQSARAWSATLSTAEPTFDEATLTLKIRLEAANPGQVLKPGMFVDVELPIDLPETLVVSADAIVDSGTRKTVFVDRGDGYFEPRQVETGWRIGNEVEVTKGLMPGERIVISGTFLIDSESRMKAAGRQSGSVAVVDPVCGMNVDQAAARAARRTAQHEGTDYYFCSDMCAEQFRKEPARYAGKAGTSR